MGTGRFDRQEVTKGKMLAKKKYPSCLLHMYGVSLRRATRVTGAGDMPLAGLLDLSLYSSFSKDGCFGKMSSFVDGINHGTHIMT